MSIQLITFDLDDTLWDVTPVMQDAEAALESYGEAAGNLRELARFVIERDT